MWSIKNPQEKNKMTASQPFSLGKIKQAATIGCAIFAAGLTSPGFGTELFVGDYALQNWSTAFVDGGGLGLNSQSITPASGNSSTAIFSWDYGYYNGPGAGTQNYFSFYTTATGNDTLSFLWQDNAFAGYYQAYQDAYAFYNDAGGFHTINLGWNTSGNTTMTVANGYTFGFWIDSGNYDLDSRLIGSLTVTNNSVPESGTTIALLGGAILGLAALRRKFARV
jgi:VPDSG-CTERM motif